MHSNHFYAGAGKAVIQLPEQVFPIKQYAGVHDELNIRVILIQNAIRVALVSVELTSIPAETIGELKKVAAAAAELEPDNVWICATHTFSAPHMLPKASVTTIEDARIYEVLQTAVHAALHEAAMAAALTLTPAEAGAAKGQCHININRNASTERGWWLGRNEEGPSVKDVNILSFNRLDNQEPIAVLFNYDVQSSIMDGSFISPGKKLITGDLAGEAARCIEGEYSAEMVAAFFTGCAGDQAPLFKACADGVDIREEGFVLVQQLGQYLGKTVVERSRQITEYTKDLAVSVWKRTAVCPEQEMLRSTRELRPETQYSYHPTGQSVEVPIEAVKIGEYLLIGTQPELNSGYGAYLKSMSPFAHVVVMTMVNGGAKYLPEEEDYTRITYTAMNTRLGRGSSEIFLNELSSLFKDIKEADI